MRNRFRYTDWRDFKTGEVHARELYDHKHDPQETVNLAGNGEYANNVADLAEQLQNTLQQPTERIR